MPFIAVKPTLGPNLQSLWKKLSDDRCSRCRSKFNVTLITIFRNSSQQPAGFVPAFAAVCGSLLHRKGKKRATSHHDFSRGARCLISTTLKPVAFAAAS